VCLQILAAKVRRNFRAAFKVAAEDNIGDMAEAASLRGAEKIPQVGAKI
jgi:hypothetical protein